MINPALTPTIVLAIDQVEKYEWIHVPAKISKEIWSEGDNWLGDDYSQRPHCLTLCLITYI